MLNDDNALKLAVFCGNVARGTSISYADSLPKGEWAETKRLARAADAAGLDGFIPLGRWKHFPPSRVEDDNFVEVMTGAAGIAAVTERIGIFSTVHMPFFHPIMFAAMASTIDHISNGRFAVNVVAGFSEPEFAMFGTELRSHEERYEFADEWIAFVKKIWTSEHRFDWDGKYFTSPDAISKPLPVQTPYPPIMSAGSSGRGRDFASEHTDLNFVHLPNWDQMPAAVANTKREALEKFGRHPGILAGGYIVCADTEKEALRRYHHVVRDQLDEDSAKGFSAGFDKNSESAHVVADRERVDRMAAGFNAMTLVGTPEMIAERMQLMSDAGLDGLAISFDNYDDGIAAYDEAIRPLLIERGLRTI